MECRSEANFTGFLAIDLEGVSFDVPNWSRIEIGCHTPLRLAFAAKLALALCLPPMGAVKIRVSMISIKKSLANVSCMS